MNRRHFLRASAAATTLANLGALRALAFSSDAAIQATLNGSSATLATVPSNYIGLSYESAQLANPSFFAASNTQLIALFRELSTDGVLRIGGGTSEFTTFTTETITTPPPFDAVGPDTSKNVKSDTPITPLSLRNLRAFLDATNWTCLYGLNLGRGTPAHAAEEAAAVHEILGPRLIAFQLGNEPDAWRNRYRPATFTYQDYWKEWQAAHAAVVEKVPQAKFAGPDISNKLPYLTGFAEDAKRSAPDVVLLTTHYYAMGPAGAPDITLAKLLAPDPKLPEQLKTITGAAHSANLPWRMCEGSSCWNGGQEGVSDTFASALWTADMMLQFARAGCAGLNFHGGGHGFYTPIAGSVAEGFTRRPEFYGILLAKLFVGSTLTQSKLVTSEPDLSAYTAVKGKTQLTLLINKTERPAAVKLAVNSGQLTHLRAPSITAREGIELITDGRPVNFKDGIATVTPYSATLIRSV